MNTGVGWGGGGSPCPARFLVIKLMNTGVEGGGYGGSPWLIMSTEELAENGTLLGYSMHAWYKDKNTAFQKNLSFIEHCTPRASGAGGGGGGGIEVRGGQEIY